MSHCSIKDCTRAIKVGGLCRKHYQNAHTWIQRHLGKPEQCENCLSINGVRYDWANISGKYLKEISDWARLCSMCHSLIDNRKARIRPEKQIFSTGLCQHGHDLAVVGIYRRSNGWIECRQCQRETLINWRKKRLKTA